MEYRLSPYRWVVLGISILAYASVYLHRMSPTVMADAVMMDLGVNAAFMGLLASAYFYPYAVMQIPSGILSDKSSPRALMTFALAMSGVGALLFAMSSSTTLIFVGRLLVGIGTSLILMPVYKATADWFTRKSYVVMASAVIALGGGLGNVFAGMPLSLSIENFGWRNSTIAIAIFTIAVSVLVWILFRDTPQKMGLPPVEEKVEAVKLEKISIPASLKIVCSKFNFWVICVAFFANGAILFSFNGLWAGLYYTNVAGLTRTEMSSLLSISAVISIVTPIIFANVIANIKSRKNVLIFSNAALFLLMLHFYMRNGVFLKPEIFAWGIILPTVASCPVGLYMTSARELFPANIAGTANGLLYAACMLGSAIYQPLIGILLDSAGYVDALNAEMFNSTALLYLVSTAIAFVSTFLLRQKDDVLI